MSLGALTFDSSWPLYGLLVVPVFMFARARLLGAAAIGYAPLQYHVGGTWPRLAVYLRLLVEGSILVVTLLGVSGLHSATRREVIKEDGIDIVLSLDVSASMMAADFKPNRLEALKRIAADFVRRSGNNRIGVYVYAKDVFTQTPLTTDHPVLLDLLKGVSYGMIDHVKSGGTATGDALLTAGNALLRNRIPGRDQVIILITDGESNFGVDPLLAARFVRTNGIRFYVIGIGGDKPSQVFIRGKPFIAVGGRPLFTKLDDTRLRAITQAAGGRYFRAKSAAVLARIFAELARLERTPLEVNSFMVRTYYTSRLAGAALALFLVWLLLTAFVIRRPML